MFAPPHIPKGIWFLGLVSLFMDISSEMIHGLLPVFLVSVIGASALTVGLIEGFGEGLALMTRVLSGAFSDWLGKRKGIIITGYLLASLAKPLFAMASSVGLVFTARSLDRFGKGLRGAPRDALIADLARPDQRGAAYGLRQSLDALGAFIGPLIAVALMSVTLNDFRSVFWWAVIPGIIAVSILVLFVQEPPKQSPVPVRPGVWGGKLSDLGTAYWIVLSLGVVFTLARFSEAFLLLRAEEVGMSHTWVPVILVVMSLVFAVGAYPVGRLSDRLGRMRLLGAGLLILIISDLVLAFAGGVFQVLAGAAFWGLHMAFTQGLFAALVADTSRKEVRGTAFGIFGLVTGIAMMAASVFAGGMWDVFGPSAPFWTGAVFSVFTLAGLLWFRHRIEKASVSPF